FRRFLTYFLIIKVMVTAHAPWIDSVPYRTGYHTAAPFATVDAGPFVRGVAARQSDAASISITLSLIE
ncbi:MAG: hypothetical protein WCE49_09400, partial [Terrimicrobiaceae bacterium]